MSLSQRRRRDKMAIVFFNNWRTLGSTEFILVEVSSIRNDDNQTVATFAVLGLGLVIVINV
jgi:hypothetical protein